MFCDTYSRLNPSYFFFFNHPATTEIYTLSLHDALPIFDDDGGGRAHPQLARQIAGDVDVRAAVRLDVSGHVAAHRESRDRKSTRLNSSHPSISYAVFCLKKKKNYKEFHRSTPETVSPRS